MNILGSTISIVSMISIHILIIVTRVIIVMSIIVVIRRRGRASIGFGIGVSRRGFEV